MIEIWKDIPGYETHYQVSNLGKVRSIKKGTIILKGDYQKNGYKRVYLWKNGGKTNKLVHRLVALTFISNPSNYSEVNHIDENKSNNSTENLQWCTRKHNMNFGTVKNKISKSNTGKKASEETLQKLSENSKNRKWINKGNIEKFIKISDVSFFIESGWTLGRKEKFI